MANAITETAASTRRLGMRSITASSSSLLAFEHHAAWIRPSSSDLAGLVADIWSTGRLYSHDQSIGVSDVTNPLLSTRLAPILAPGVLEDRATPWLAPQRLGRTGRQR